MKVHKYLLHSFMHNKLRTTMAVLSVLVTFSMMITISLFFATAQETDFDEINKWVGYDIEVQSVGHADLNPVYMNITEVEDTLDTVSGIESVNPVLTTYGMTLKGFEPNHFFELIGTYDDYQAGFVESSVGEYRLGWGECVLSVKAAYSFGEQVGKHHATVGDKITVWTVVDEEIVSTQLTVTGIYEVSGRFRWENPYAHGSYVVMNLDYLQNLTGLENKASTITITVDQNLYDLQDPTNPAKEVEAIAKNTASKLGEDYDVSAPKAAAIGNTTSSFLTSLSYLFAILLPAISGILVSSVMNLSVEEKSQEIATLRLLGARRSFVLKVVMAELASILAFGIALAFPLGFLIGQATIFLFQLDMQLTGLELTGQLIMQIAIGVGVTVLFSIMPIIRALKTNPAEAINRVKSSGSYKFVSSEGVDKKLVLGGLFVFIAIMISFFSILWFLQSIRSGGEEICIAAIGMMIIIPASLSVSLLFLVPYMETIITFIFYPVTKKTNKITRKSIKRNVRRNVSTNIIFGIIVGILILFSSMFSSIMASTRESAEVGIGSEVKVDMWENEMPISDLFTIQEIDGVDTAGGATAFKQVTVSDVILKESTNAFAIGFDKNVIDSVYQQHVKLKEGSRSDIRDMDDDDVTLSTDVAERLDVSKGDKISITVERDGGTTKKMFFEVKAVVDQMPGYVGVIGRNTDVDGIAFSLEGYSKVFGISMENLTYTAIFIDCESKAITPQVVEKLQERFGSIEGVWVTDTQEAILGQQIVMGVLQAVFTAISSLLMVVALFSLLANLYASVKEREYEIGVLKAMGLKNLDVLVALMLEGLAIALVSMVIGVFSGLVVSWLGIYAYNSVAPLQLSFLPPYAVMAYLLIFTAVMGLAGSFLPAILVARKPIIALMKRIE